MKFFYKTNCQSLAVNGIGVSTIDRAIFSDVKIFSNFFAEGTNSKTVCLGERNKRNGASLEEERRMYNCIPKFYCVFGIQSN